MNICEVKTKLPEAEVYEFKPECRYLLLVNPDLVEKKVAMQLGMALMEQGVYCMLAFVVDVERSIRLLEFPNEGGT